MLSSQEKYQHALTLRRALNARHEADEVVKAEAAILTAYVAESGDTSFRWGGGLTLTYVRGSEPKKAVDEKAFIEAARAFLTQAQYDACVKAATKIKGGRKPSFR